MRTRRTSCRRAATTRTRWPPAWWRPSTRTRASASSSSGIVDLERIKAAAKRLLVEPLYGSGAGWFTRLLGDGRLTVRELHTERNPFFGGVNPEPIRPNIDAWLEEIPRWGADIGIAFDGDADRVGHGDRGGRLRQPAAGLRAAVLVPARRARADRSGGLHRYHHLDGAAAGRDFGTQAYETGVGFKYVGPKMTETHAVIGGEESGGFGFGMHIPERDGLASGLFLLDLWLTKGKQASEVLAELQALAGPSYYNRIDIRFAREGYDALKADTLRGSSTKRRRRWRGGRWRAASRWRPATGSSSTATMAPGC